MKCAKCGVPVTERNLVRVNEMGVEGIFWCEPCIKKYEPELYRNHLEDESDVEKTLKKICYPND